MNSRFRPDASAVPLVGETKAAPTAAIVTPSYAGDFERCRLLCETVDRFVTGHRHHYLLVAHNDVELFRRLESRNRLVIDERDLLPSWLHDFRDPASLFRRHVWLSLKTAPLRGWHVQQLRRIALAAHAHEDALIYCDSDMVFLKPFDCGQFWKEGKLRLYRRQDGLSDFADAEHRQWSLNAARALGLPAEMPSMRDYISTLIAWRRETVGSMIRHIETRHARSWVETVASTRRFSECMLYGRYVDEVLSSNGHFHDDAGFCRVYWSGPELSGAQIASFIAGMEPEQVAIGLQSFTGTDIGQLRKILFD